jgi:hypothetical protein
MQAEGMVHALEIVHSLIKPGGLLVDIHPLGDPPAIQVLLQGQTIQVGWLQESDNFIEYPQATDALAQVITRGWFALDQQGEFIFITHATSWEDLENYLKAKWHDAILPEGAALRVQRLREELGAGIEIALEERIGIKTLVALRG